MKYPWEMSKKQFYAALCCFFCSFIITFNSTMISSTLTQFQEAWGVDYSFAMWFKQDIAISMIIFSLFSIALADKIGKKRALMMGLAIIILSSIFCVLTRSFAGIMIFRMMTGFGASLVSVSNLSILTDATKKEHLTESIAMLTSSSCLGAIFAPSIGLWWTNTFGIRTIFLILIPLCGICLMMVRGVENKISRPDLNINYLLHILFIAGMFVIMLDLFNTMLDYRILLLVIGILLLMGFILVNHYSEDKIFDARIFKIKPFTVALLIGVMFSFINYAIDDTVSGYLQIVDGTVILLGMSVTLMAVASFVSGLKPFIQAVFSPVVAKWNTKHPKIDFTLIGFIILAVPVFLMVAVLVTADLQILAFMAIVIYAVLAVASTLFSPSNKEMMMGSVPDEDRNFASSMTMIVSPTAKVMGTVCLLNLLDGYTTRETYSTAGISLASIIIVVFVIGALLLFSRTIHNKKRAC